MSKKIIFSLFTLHLHFTPIFAQIAAPDSTTNSVGPEIVVIAQKDRLLSKVPGAANYVKPIELRRLAPVSGNEVFRKLPGINVVDEEGIGLRVNIGIRGLDPDRSANVLVLEDGIPVQLNPYGEPEMYYSPAIDRMSAIEVVKGSGQIQFGPRTIGGVINYVTADAPANRETKILMKGGSGGFFSSQVQFGNTFGNTGLVVNFLRKQADKIGVTGFGINDLNAKINFSLGEKSVLGLKAQVYDETSNSTYVGLTQNMFDSGEYFPIIAPDDELNVRRYAIAAIHKYFISNNLKLQTNAFAHTISRDWRRQSFTSDGSKPNQTGVVWGDASIPQGAVFMLNETGLRNRSFDVAGVESKLAWDYRIGHRKQQFEAGLRFISETAHEQEFKGLRPNSRSGTLVADEFRPGEAVSGFVHNQFSISRKLSVSAGFRAENYVFERQIRLVQKSGNLLADTNIVAMSRVSAFIPGLGFNFKLDPKANLFGGVHKGFAPPGIKNSVSKSGEIFPLDAQESWNYELGIRANPSNGFEAELTAFFLDFSKQVIPVSESSGGSGSGFANGGRTEHKGIETAVKLDFGKFFQSKYSVYWEGNATFSQGKYAADRFVGPDKINVRGNFLPYAPEFMTTQTIGFSAPTLLEIQVSGTYVSSQFSDELNTQTPSADGRIGKIPAFFVPDASARYELAKWKTSFSLAVKNFFDNRYMASRRPQGIKVGVPRLLVFGAEVKF